MSEVTRSGEDILAQELATTTELQTLNTNGAKEAKQDTMITSLSAIEAGVGTGNTGAASTVAASATSVSLLAAEGTRISAVIRNDSNKSMYVEYGATATLNSAWELKRGDILVVDDYTGEISGIWEAAPTGNARITENTNV